LAVPEYMDIESLEDLTDHKNGIGDKVDWDIVRIDSGADGMDIAEVTPTCKTSTPPFPMEVI